VLVSLRGQNLAQINGEISHMKRLLDEPFAAGLHNGIGLFVDGIATGQKDWQIRLQLSNFIEGFPTTHSRHSRSEQHQIDFITFASSYINSFIAPVGDTNRLANSLQHGSTHIKNNFFIINQEDGLLALRQFDHRHLFIDRHPF
jgi:hypothetical protein